MTSLTFPAVLCITGTMLLAGCNLSVDDEATTTPENDLVDVEFVDLGSQNPSADAPQTEPEPVFGDPNVCTPEGINAWVDAQMRDYYIYFDQVPVVNPSDYADAAALLDDLRVQPDEYSNISPQSDRENLFEEGETFGFGFRWQRDQEGALRFSNIVIGSPMEAAGARRGDRVLAINGVVETDLTEALVNQFFGEQGVETTVSFTIQRSDSESEELIATSSTFIIGTVGEVRTYQVNGSTVGYIESSIFLRTTEADLDAAVETLMNENPSDVILDFRYNGGGYVYIAQKFSAQLVGNDFAGRTFQTSSFNSRYSQFDNTALLQEQALTLDLPRVIILTTQSTASASEAIANNLRPYIDVVLIGSNTRGKPFASVSNPNCELVLNAMDRVTSNEAGETVLGGLIPTCPVTDDFLHPKNDPNDALLGAALTYLETNACPTVVAWDDSNEFRANVFQAPIDAYQEPDIAESLFNQALSTN